MGEMQMPVSNDQTKGAGPARTRPLYFARSVNRSVNTEHFIVTEAAAARGAGTIRIKCRAGSRDHGEGIQPALTTCDLVTLERSRIAVERHHGVGSITIAERLGKRRRYKTAEQSNRG